MRNIEALLRQIDRREISDLVAEVGDKNVVTVRVDRGTTLGKRVVYHSRNREILDASQVLTNAFLGQYDRLRALAGKPMIYVPEAMRRCGAEFVGVGSNLRTNVGIDYTSVQLGGTAATTVAKYVAVTNNTNTANVANTATNTTATRICWGTASATDAAASTSRGEYTALGVARAAATYAHTTTVTSYTQTITYTASGTITSLQAAGMFDAATQNTGTLFLETLFTATSLVTSDQLTLTWTVNC